MKRFFFMFTIFLLGGVPGLNLTLSISRPLKVLKMIIMLESV